MVVGVGWFYSSDASSEESAMNRIPSVALFLRASRTPKKGRGRKQTTTVEKEKEEKKTEAPQAYKVLPLLS